MAEQFGQLLGQFRLLTYGQLISRAVTELEKPAVADAVHATLRHLIVDEYQDVNPAQERLIELLTGPQVELCVVGDDDQAIYQWRGSDVSNIVEFRSRYDGVRTFSIMENNEPGAQIGGQDRGHWYYGNLAIYISNYAKGAYEDFDGEPDVEVDAVDLTTVHKAKGLEWPVVFVPSLTNRRFLSSKTGQSWQWLVPKHLFSPERYEGSDADERRLIYVAMTRARDRLSLSRHERTAKNRAVPSPYYLEVADLIAAPPLPLPTIDRIIDEEVPEPLALTFSELAAYRACGFAYRLRSMIGFQPLLAPELGYGKAVHHILRAVAEHTRKHGQPPDQLELDRMFNSGFFLPATCQQRRRRSWRSPSGRSPGLRSARKRQPRPGGHARRGRSCRPPTAPSIQTFTASPTTRWERQSPSSKERHTW